MGNQINSNVVYYKIGGEVEVTCWDGDYVIVKMKPYCVEELDDEEIIDGVNDNGFGCKRIEFVWADIYEVYEDGYEKFIEGRQYECVGDKLVVCNY